MTFIHGSRIERFRFSIRRVDDGAAREARTGENGAA